MSTYQERLDGARQALAEAGALLDRTTLPVGLADQLNAAASDTRRLFARFVAATAIVNPDLTPGGLPAAQTGKVHEVLARTIAAMPEFALCSHLRRAPGQPGVVRMALRRLDCHRCMATSVNPPPGEDDRCDWCGRHGITTFWPVSYTLGLILAYGDACGDCATGLVPDQSP